jgi:hypothetical protein
MPLIARVLPPAEWPRILTEQPESPLAQQFAANGIPDPASARICIVEREGRIVGSWMIFMACHAEPVYVNEDARTPSVIKALLEQMVTALQAEGVTHAFALIADVDLLKNAPMAHHLGFQKAPGEPPEVLTAIGDLDWVKQGVPLIMGQRSTAALDRRAVQRGYQNYADLVAKAQRGGQGRGDFVSSVGPCPAL